MKSPITDSRMPRYRGGGILKVPTRRHLLMQLSQSRPLTFWGYLQSLHYLRSVIEAESHARNERVLSLESIFSPGVLCTVIILNHPAVWTLTSMPRKQSSVPSSWTGTEFPSLMTYVLAAPVPLRAKQNLVGYLEISLSNLRMPVNPPRSSCSSPYSTCSSDLSRNNCPSPSTQAW